MFCEDKVDYRRFEATSKVGFDCALPVMCPFPGTAREDARVLWVKHDATLQQWWQGSQEVGGCSRRSGLGSVVPGAAARVSNSRCWCEESCRRGLGTRSCQVPPLPSLLPLLWAHAKLLHWCGQMCPLPGRMEGLQQCFPIWKKSFLLIFFPKHLFKEKQLSYSPHVKPYILHSRLWRTANHRNQLPKERNLFT